MTIDEFLMGDERKYEDKDGILFKINFNNKLDFIYSPLYHRIEYNNDLKTVGIYNRETQKLYGNSYYFDNDNIPNLKSKLFVCGVSTVKEHIQKDVNDMLNEHIIKNKDELIDKGKKLFDEYMKDERHFEHIKKDAAQKYIYHSEKEELVFNIPLGCSNNRLEDNILSYIEYSDNVKREIYNSYLNNWSTTIYSESVGVPNINNVKAEEHIGFRILKEELKRNLVEEFNNAPNNEYKKKHDIIKSIKDLEAQTVTIQIRHNNKELEFKYPKDQLYRFYLEGYYIPDVSSRNKLKELYFNEKPNDDEYIKDIVAIKYRGKPIYQDEKMINLSKENSIEEEMELE